MSDTYKFRKGFGHIERGANRYGTRENDCECPECYGGGKFGMFACKNCKGTGRVKKENESIKSNDAGRCSACDGTGIYKGKECAECSGTGFEMSS